MRHVVVHKPGDPRQLHLETSNDPEPAPVQTFPLHQVASAHRALESGSTVGKLTLLP